MAQGDATPSAHLSISGDTIQIHGDGPIAANFTKEMARRLLALPSVSNFWARTDDTTLLASGILRRLTKSAHESLVKVVNSDHSLKEQYEYKCKHFAAYAYPSTGQWPPHDRLMVLESIPIDQPFLMTITWFLDGSIHLTMLNGVDSITLSEAEFTEGYGKTFREYCEEQLPRAIEKCQRTLSLVSVEKPTKAIVSYINRKSEVEKKTVVYWQSDQIEQYLISHELSHIATDEDDSSGDKGKDEKK